MALTLSQYTKVAVSPIMTATLVYCDNVSAIYLSSSPVQHQRTKHIEMDIHFALEKVARGQVCVLHISSCYQIANIFTKGLPLVLFEDFRNSLNVRPPPTSTIFFFGANEGSTPPTSTMGVC